MVGPKPGEAVSASRPSDLWGAYSVGRSYGTVGSEFANCKSVWVSISCYATVQLTKFRNNEDEYGKAQEMGGCETFVRRFTSEIGYALLFLVSLVETCVRLILILIIVPLTIGVMLCGMCLCDREIITGDVGEFLMGISLGGALFTGQNVANSAVAIGANICQEEIKYDKLIPWFEEHNGTVKLF